MALTRIVMNNSTPMPTMKPCSLPDSYQPMREATIGGNIPTTCVARPPLSPLNAATASEFCMRNTPSPTSTQRAGLPKMSPISSVPSGIAVIASSLNAANTFSNFVCE